MLLPLLVDTSAGGLLVSRGDHPASSRCVDSSDDGLLVLESIIRPVVSVLIPLMMDYLSSRVSSAQESVC